VVFRPLKMLAYTLVMLIWVMVYGRIAGCDAGIDFSAFIIIKSKLCRVLSHESVLASEVGEVSLNSLQTLTPVRD
jgi:hypothetical protein